MIFRRWKEHRLRRSVDQQWEIGVYEAAIGEPCRQHSQVTPNAMAYNAGYLHGDGLRREQEMARESLGTYERPELVMGPCPEPIWEHILAAWREHFA